MLLYHYLASDATGSDSVTVSTATTSAVTSLTVT